MNRPVRVVATLFVVSAILLSIIFWEPSLGISSDEVIPDRKPLLDEFDLDSQEVSNTSLYAVKFRRESDVAVGYINTSFLMHKEGNEYNFWADVNDAPVWSMDFDFQVHDEEMIREHADEVRFRVTVEPDLNFTWDPSDSITVSSEDGTRSISAVQDIPTKTLVMARSEDDAYNITTAQWKTQTEWTISQEIVGDGMFNKDRGVTTNVTIHFNHFYIDSITRVDT